MIAFSGRVKVRINQQRLVFPVEFREQFLEDGDDAVVVTVRPDRRALLIFPYSTWRSFHEAMNNGTEEEQDIISAMEINTQPKQRFEGPGRIKIDPEYLEMVGIDGSDAVMLGEGRMVSMWSPSMFAEEDRERTGKAATRYRPSVFKTWKPTTSR
jgi:DNA-binding transcriptional regulator/RsmH inhibitor MraZ